LAIPSSRQRHRLNESDHKGSALFGLEEAADDEIPSA